MSALQKFKRTFSFKKKKKHRDNSETSKPIQWQEDERKVREGTCSFQVKYLGCTEVFESRGMQVCEEAIKALKGSFHSKTKQQRAVLYVSGDQLRVVDEISKGLIVDQTIEKVSFCAPDRHHDKGFAYICRDGASRRWMCHGFMSVKESGERLSHAVGCAFAVCLEKKQKREKDAVQVTFNEQGTSFARMGSFRPATLTERLQDPQSAIIAEPVPSASSPTTTTKPGGEAAAIPRPRATAGMIDRQGSLRLFPKLADTSSPFKRDLSLRLNDLPSTLQRQHIFGNGDEVSPVKEEDEDDVAKAAKDLSSQMNSLSTNLDPFAPTSNPNVVTSTPNVPPPITHPRPSLPNGSGFESASSGAAFADPFGTPRVRSSVPAMPTSFDPFATAPVPFNPTPAAPAPSPGQVAITYQQQPHPASVSTNPFAPHPQPGHMTGATANPWAGAPSPWAPVPAPRQMGVDRRDGSGDPFDVAWAERHARTSDSSTNPFVSANNSSNIVARGLPSANASTADKGFRMGV